MAPDQRSKNAAAAPTPSTPAPSTLDSETAADIPPKPSRVAWKTRAQLEYLFSEFQNYHDHQDAGTLARFWPRIYDTWYQRWATPNPTRQAIGKHGSLVNATLVLRTENNCRIRTWFHNKNRPSSGASKSDLKPSQTERRKLAPVQAYCAYAWDLGLKDTVIAWWEEQKQTYLIADDDDPPADLSDPSTPGAHIPIDFKLKIAREEYNELTQEEKDAIDNCCEEERKKLYMLIPQITDVEERDKKLLMHQHNQPAVPKALSRILKNLEDQTGCVAQLFVAHIDPGTGKTSCHKFCQGKTGLGLDFQAFSGRVFDDVIEKGFRDWALRVFGDKESARRALFMLSESPSEQGATSSSASCPGTSRPAAEQPTEPPPGIDATMVDEGDAAGVPPPSQVFETMQAVPAQPSIPPPPASQPSVAMSLPPGPNPGASVLPQISELPQFVSPQEIFAPPQSLETGSPTFASSHVPEQFQTTPPGHAPPSLVDESPVVTTPPSVTLSLVFGSSHVVAPHQIDASPVVAAPSLVPHTPVLGSPQVVNQHRPDASSMVTVPPLTTPSPVVESSQTVTPPQVNSSQELGSQHQITDPSPQVIHNPQTAVVSHSSDPTGGNFGAAVTTTSAYKPKARAATNTSTRSRRDSIEGAPDIILTLGGAGYEIATPQSQREPPVTFAENNVDTPIDAPSPSPDELMIPSSQRTIEECLTIPTEGQANVLNPFHYAPRIVPDYSIERSDFPSWLLERGRLDYVLSVEAGDVWEKLITTWLRQERRLGFGLNERLGGSLSMKMKPKIFGDYFKWHHTPSKGDSVTLQAIGDETAAWWSSIQPEWRYKDESSSDSPRDYSYILAGGKKGVYLLILCLAWWDRAHGRNMEQEKARRREAAKTAGIDDTTLNFADLRKHEHRWFNIVNDLIFVLEHAQGWPVPGEGMTTNTAVVAPARIAPARKKRATKQSGNPSPRKKVKSA